MLWACIHLPQLALDGVLRRRARPERPLVLVTGTAQARSLHSVNAAAAAAGLQPGMALSAAHALLPDFEIHEYQPRDEARWQQLLAAWAWRYSSRVCAQWPDGVLLEVGASFSLLGPWPQLEARMRGELLQLGFTHRIALAPVAAAARVLARVCDGLACMRAEAMVRALDRVALAWAGLPDGCDERLQRMGIRDLGALRRLPRAGLRRRFGAILPEYLDHLYGNVIETLAAYRPPDRFDQRLELGHEVETHTALLFPLRRLLQDLGACLAGRDGGVQRFVLRLEHEAGGHDLEVGLLAAERDPATLFELVRKRLEHVRLERPVVALRLLARELPPFIPAMQDLFESRSRQATSWAQLHERLRARLGDDCAHRLRVRTDPRPERAWQALVGEGPAQEVVTPQLPPRPLWLLSRPIPLRDPAPRIIAGPERLESGWWDGADARRDYYVLETSRGQRAWVFAPPGEQGNWMLHGWFA